MKSSKQPPIISVVMPVWNGEAYLASAIDSILAQTWTDFEFLILDDGSTDRSPLILADYASKDCRIRVIQLEHEGIVMALNRGVAEAKATWIARMDCDDIAHPQRLERQLHALIKTNADLCYTGITIIGDLQDHHHPGRVIHSKALLALRLCYHCPIVHPTVMFKKETFLNLGGYQPNERHAEDYGLWGKFVENGIIVGLSEKLLSYRVHPLSISRKMADIQLSLAEEIEIRHCMNFLHLDQKNAIRALMALRNSGKFASLSEWFWLITFCIPRMRWQSIELWAWVTLRTIKILVFRFLILKRKLFQTPSPPCI